MNDTDPYRAFLQYAATKLEQNLAQIGRSAALLSTSELWHRANAHANSVGNLILHLTGNVRQWLLSGVGGQPGERDRPTEFAERGPLPVATVLSPLQQVVQAGLRMLTTLNTAALGSRRCIQGYDVCVLTAVFHVVEHFSFHTGQIVHITKLLKDVDLSLYDEQGHKRSGDERMP